VIRTSLPAFALSCLCAVGASLSDAVAAGEVPELAQRAQVEGPTPSRPARDARAFDGSTAILTAELRARLSAKRAVRELSEDHARALLERRGFTVRRARFEEVAVYAEAPLSQATRASLTADGIEWVGDLWIPPVAGDARGRGHHPLGFHLARVPLEGFEALARTPGVRRLHSAERTAEVASDLGRSVIGAEALQAGDCVYPRTGKGVSIAILDSGYDLASPDLPEPIEALDVTEGDTFEAWSSDVTDTGTGHGTHVSSVCFGNGASSGGQYRGIATDADVYVYKVADDATQLIFETDLVKGLARCATVGVDLANLSIAMYSTFMDGSGPACQAVDAATAAGVMVLAAAGNEAELERHVSFTLGPGESSPAFDVSLFNPVPLLYDTPEVLRVLWRDGQPGDANIELIAEDPEDDLEELWFGTSQRDTEARSYRTTLFVPGGATVTESFRLVNHATDGPPVKVHVYRTGGYARLTPDDPGSTMTVPAIADTAVSIGAWCHRDTWIDGAGDPQHPEWLTEGGPAGFTSRGPRIDGLAMPHLAAPGAAVIGLIDAQHTPPAWVTIDDDGIPGEGPVTHMVRFGTSYATPMVAACLALLKEAHPERTFEELLDALRATASQAAAPDEVLGAGLIDVLTAALSLQPIGCNALVASSFNADAEQGDSVDFRVHFGPEHEGRTYWILGTLTGTAPGVSLSPTQSLPLNVDSYTLGLISSPLGPPMVNGFGELDANGEGVATLELPPGFGAILAGEVAHHMVLALEFAPNTDWVKAFSDPVPLSF
jgi:subtilisin family serine protease